MPEYIFLRQVQRAVVVRRRTAIPLSSNACEQVDITNFININNITNIANITNKKDFLPSRILH